MGDELLDLDALDKGLAAQAVIDEEVCVCTPHAVEKGLCAIEQLKAALGGEGEGEAKPCPKS